MTKLYSLKDIQKNNKKFKYYCFLNGLTLGKIDSLKNHKKEYFQNFLDSNVDYDYYKYLDDNVHKFKYLNSLTLGIFKYFRTKKQQNRNKLSTFIEQALLRNNSNGNNNKEQSIARPYEFSKFNIDIDNTPVTEKLLFPKFDEITVSIVIPCYNNFDITMKCLRSILKNTNNVKYEVIIADDKSKDNISHIEDFTENVIRIVNQKDNGFINNCNSGASIARGKYIFFLNNDTQVQPNYLKPLVDTIEREPNIGLIGSMLLYPDGTVQEAGGGIFKNASGINFFRCQKDINNPKINYVRDVFYISGAAILVPKDLFKELNGFDTVYCPAYCEDSDLALRIRYWKKQRVVYQPLSKIVHFEGASFSDKKKNALIERNVQKLYDRFSVQLSCNHEMPEYQTPTIKSFDASLNKKYILVIDWKILSPSFDTGSRVTLQYMQLFQKMGFVVKYYPFELYKEKDEFLTDIQQLGIEVIFEPLDYYLEQNKTIIDAIFLNRPDIASRALPIIKKHTNAYIIYHGHDLHYLRKYRENISNGMFKTLAENILNQEKAKELDVYKKMDLSVFVSNSEKELIQKELPRTFLTSIPIFLLDPLKMNNFSYDAKTRTDIAFVAGFKHNPNIDAAVYFVNEILPSVQAKFPNIKIYIIGSHPDEKVKKLGKNPSVIVTGYVTDEELEDYYKKIRLVVVPLRYGAGVKGKVIEALYNKVPVVTTSIGAEGIDNSSNIMQIADSAEDMSKAICNLYDDFNKLNELSNMSTSFITEHYTEKSAVTSISNYLPSHIKQGLNLENF